MVTPPHAEDVLCMTLLLYNIDEDEMFSRALP